MKVYYMNGAGNDFMVLDARGLSLNFEELSVALCKLTGADGFMAVDSCADADFRLHFYNSDGSRGEMCGNGARCICRFAYELGIAGESMTVRTDAGPVPGQRLDRDHYRVRLNSASILDLNRKENAAYVELGCPGVPHSVTEYPGELWKNKENLKPGMEALRHDPAFPKGANVNFFQELAPGEVRMLTFERGVENFTMACGTGTGSTALVLDKQDRLPEHRLTAHNPGGTLTVEIREEEIFLEGPTEIVKVFDIAIG